MAVQRGYQHCVSAIQSAAPGIKDDDIEEILSAIIRREPDPDAGSL
jgi:hypothetical protein